MPRWPAELRTVTVLDVYTMRPTLAFHASAKSCSVPADVDVVHGGWIRHPETVVGRHMKEQVDILHRSFGEKRDRSGSRE